MIAPKKVLIINIFGIGDVLFTTPLVSNLKQAYPDLYIGYLSNRRTASIVQTNPKINQVFIYERDEFVEASAYSPWKLFVKWIKFIDTIRKERFDMVIDVSLNSGMSFLSWAAGVPQRVGFNYKNRSRFFTKEIPLEGYEDKPVADYYLDILEMLGIPVKIRQLELSLSPNDHNWAKNFFTQNNIASSQLTIGFVPGGGASWGKDAVLKRWPPEKYAKLADKIVEKLSAQIILMGDEKEKDLCSRVANLMKHRPLSACGETTIHQFAALAKRCALVVVNDGGPLHVAVAAGAKTVSIFGPVDDLVYGPYPQGNHFVVKRDLPCRPCYRRFRKASCEHLSCLNQITVDDVLRKVEEAV